LADFLEALRKLYEIPLPASDGPSSGNGNALRPTADREAYLSWAVEKLMKNNAIDIVAAREAEDQARAIFDSDDSTHTGSLGELPPDVDDEDSLMSGSSTDGNE
jgi:hypothetical protein